MKRHLIIYVLAIVAMPMLLAAPTEAKKVKPEDLVSEAETAAMNYDLELAQEYFDRYREHYGKNANTYIIEGFENYKERVETMLGRVEKVEVIDSINVDAEAFFKAYKLSPETGSFLAPSEMPEGLNASGCSMGYMTQDGSQIFWGGYAATDSIISLHTSHKLSDGAWEAPIPLGDWLTDGGEADYPFLMADGSTLYFANDGDNSIGGYDIYITTHDGEQFRQPQNLGMPYNSPYNDYLLAIDEITGLGWFASDRSQIENVVTIYIFIPSEMRENYPADTENIKELALLSSIKATQKPGKDYTDLLAKVKNLKNGVVGETNKFEFRMPDGTIYTSLDQFQSEDARFAMEDYLELNREIKDLKAELSQWRKAFAAGDKSVSHRILTAENKLLNLNEKVKSAANKVITYEKQK